MRCTTKYDFIYGLGNYDVRRNFGVCNGLFGRQNSLGTFFICPIFFGGFGIKKTNDYLKRLAKILD